MGRREASSTIWHRRPWRGLPVASRQGWDAPSLERAVAPPFSVRSRCPRATPDVRRIVLLRFGRAHGSSSFGPFGSSQHPRRLLRAAGERGCELSLGPLPPWPSFPRRGPTDSSSGAESARKPFGLAVRPPDAPFGRVRPRVGVGQEGRGLRSWFGFVSPAAPHCLRPSRGVRSLLTAFVDEAGVPGTREQDSRHGCAGPACEMPACTRRPMRCAETLTCLGTPAVVPRPLKSGLSKFPGIPGWSATRVLFWITLP